MADLDPDENAADENAEDVSIFGRRRGWDDDEHDDDEDDGDEHDRRNTKRFALWALAIVVVVVAVAITLVSLLVDTSSPPATPRATAQRWANDLVHGNDDDRRSLECDDSQSGGVLTLIVVAPTAVHAGPAETRGSNRWSVPLTFDEAGGGTSGASVTVLRRKGDYLVC